MISVDFFLFHLKLGSQRRGVKKSSMVAESVHLNFLEQKLFSAEIVHFNNLKTCQCRKCNHEKSLAAETVHILKI